MSDTIKVGITEENLVKCKYCKGMFVQTRIDRMYCNIACQKEGAKSASKNCEICNKVYYYYPKHNSRTCSMSCGAKLSGRIRSERIKKAQAQVNNLTIPLEESKNTAKRKIKIYPIVFQKGNFGDLEDSINNSQTLKNLSYYKIINITCFPWSVAYDKALIIIETDN